MENDLNTALAVSLIQNKPVGMDIVDYVTHVQSKIMEKENELFFQEFLYDSESNIPCDQQVEDNLSCADFQGLKEYCDNPIVSPQKKMKFDCEFFTSNLLNKSNTCLVQPIITMKALNEATKTPNDSGYNTYEWNINFKNTNQKLEETMSQTIQKALDILVHTLFENTLLLEVVVNWNDCNNTVRYFVNLVAGMAESNEYGFTCCNHVMSFVKNITFKIVDNHHLYSSLHVEYQCNLLAKFCYDKYIRCYIVNLLINRLKNVVEIIVPNYNSLRSIYYTFHLIDKLLCNIYFNDTIEATKNKNKLTDLWRINHQNKRNNETENLDKMLKEWKRLLEYISMEALKKNVFLVSIRANQCLDSLKLIRSES